MKILVRRMLCWCIFMILLLPGCSQSQPLSSIEYVIGVSLANMRDPWRLILADELKNEAAQYPQVRLVFADATSESKKQVADINRLLGYGIDLLIVSPNDAEELTGVIADIYKDIPVIVLDRMVEGYDYTLFIGPDNELIGTKAGEAVTESNDGSPVTILELSGNDESKSTIDRSFGFSNFIADYPFINVHTTSIESESRDAAEDYIEAIEMRLPEIDLIFAHNDYIAWGASIALEKLGYSDIRIIGVDGSAGIDGGLEMVRNGVIDCTITCPTGGREAINYAMDILNGVSGIPKQVILRSKSITQHNLAAYEAQLYEQTHLIGSKINVGYAQLGTESSWRLANNLSIVNAAQDFGINLTVLDANGSQSLQVKHLRTFIEMEMDVIVLSPVVDTGWADVLAEAKAAGIPVLLSDRKVSVSDEELYQTYIGADFIEEGRRAMRWIVQNIPQEEKPVRILEIQGTPGASPTIERKYGFESRLNDETGYEIIDSMNGDFTFEGGQAAVAYYLEKNGFDFNVVFAHNDDMALGAILALEQAGIQPGDDVKIISVDGTKSALEALIEGKMNCVVECSPLLGPQLMKAIMDLMSGQKLPLRIITDEIVFTKDNAPDHVDNRQY